MADTLRWNKLSTKKKEYLALALIMLLAAFLRFFQLDAIPVGLDVDEAEEGWEARRVIEGEGFPIFFTASYGGEPMHYYAIALFLRLFGVKALSVRLASAVEGLLLVPVIYLLASELFPPGSQSRSSVPLLSAFWVATSYWHITYSRTGMEPVLLPLALSAGTFFLWRGIRLVKRRPFLLAGFFLGASLYTYRAVRFFPLLLLIFLGYRLLADRKFRQTHLANLILLGAVFTLVVLPLGLYAIANPEMFIRRELAVTIVGPDWHDRPVPLSILEGMAKTFGMYNFVPDPQFERNPGQRPILDPLSSLFFLVGLALAWVRRREAAYAFVLLWLIVMSLPGALTPDVSPQYSRGMGALPAVALLFSLGVDSSTTWLQRRRLWPTVQRAYWPVLCLVLVCVTFLSCRDYFFPWMERQRQGIVTAARAIEAAEVMNTTHVPAGVWILPASSVDASRLPFFQINFLYQGVLPHHTLHADETSCAQELSGICQGRDTALVVTWTDFIMEKAYESLYSDPKGLIDFLLRKYGRYMSSEPHDSFDLVSYRLPPAPDFSIASSFDPLDVSFGDELHLEGVALGGSSLNATSTPQEVERNLLPSGKEGWVVLLWRTQADLEADYKVAVYLLDSQGRVAGQTDKLLLSNYLQTTSRWDAGQLEMDYYILPCQPATPPGEYTVEATVYNADTLERLSVFDAETGVSTTSVPIGTLQVIEPLTPAEVQPQEQLPSSRIDLAPGLQLLGFDLPVRVASPGQTVSVALYWRATEDVDRDYLLSLLLNDANQEALVEQQGRPVDDTYPTTEWEKGEVLRDWHDLQLPPDIPTGDYELTLRVLEGSTTIGQASLGWIEVSGRPHRFDVPDIQHALEATLGDGVLFLGYDLSSEDVKPGDTLHLTLYWQALSEMQVSYTVFTHLLDAKQQIWGQMDSIPLRGEAPTTGWIPGEIITDSYDLVMEPAAPPGSYTVEVGMYDATTGQRLPVLDASGQAKDDRILLQGTEVLAAEGE
jgi:4-amino-4-deoxy-L-arabinose transferase-like glycosyltransferase